MSKKRKQAKSSGKLPPHLQGLVDSGRFEIVSHKKRGTISICMPMHRAPNPLAVGCLQGLVGHFGEQGTGYDLRMRFRMGAIIGHMRAQAMHEAIEEEDDAILFIDDDMTYPVGGEGFSKDPTFNPLKRLLDRDKEIVGALCTSRSLPMHLNVGSHTDDGYFAMCEDFNVGHVENGEMFQTDLLGFGMVLIRRSAMLKVFEYVNEVPSALFSNETIWEKDPENVKKIGTMIADGFKAAAIIPEIKKMERQSRFYHEDFSFCMKARAAGCEIWVDPSFEVQHHGDYGYTRLDWMAQQQERARYQAEQAAKDLEKQAAGG
jgi:hypothetical protein